MRQKPKRYTTFFERRRARQARGDAGRSYTFELAALHLQLLIAMAAVDDEIRSIEVDEILGFIDRTSLAHDDITRLSELARASIAAPPELRVLATQLEAFARRPALARLIVADLATVAAADSRADPREVTLLRFVCEALNLDTVPIVVPEPVSRAGGARAPAAPRPARIVASHRVRTAVRTALEASYESREGPFG